DYSGITAIDATTVPSEPIRCPLLSRYFPYCTPFRRKSKVVAKSKLPVSTIYRYYDAGVPPFARYVRPEESVSPAAHPPFSAYRFPPGPPLVQRMTRKPPTRYL